MSEILHLNLHREFFAAIANKQKRIEYRKQSRYWRKRLEERKYDAILFRNGYAKDAPEMLVEFRGLRRYGKGRDRLLCHPPWTHIENQTVAEGASVMSPSRDKAKCAAGLDCMLAG